ncbi:glycosyltransferase family 2 protein [Aliiroseovarius subalbicans]|uniref:glycosyltransferase family 2 protein n=1 Tax=Aliiroseovarius subalbicans TaxID=2925840 RepID=UPI001F583184|nr:glycosyltransferase family 2 protein [Aliiroseovarius subalbicans]MCI2398852.1 glycosyltransferase family 2 protein [Aliiroseovarius subalbicans]
MRIYLHIGLEQCGATRIQEVLDNKRDQLSDKGVLYPRTPGRKNHTRLYMAVSDPDRVDVLRANRGFTDPAAQEKLRADVARDLAAEVAKHNPDVMILSASQLCTLSRPSELARLKALLLPLSDDIRVVAHVDEQGRVLARHYAEAVFSGRVSPLDQELSMLGAASWRDAALADWDEVDPRHLGHPEIQAPPFWLDYPALVTAWEEAFGDGRVALRAYDADLFASERLTDEIRDAFSIKANIGKAAKGGLPAMPAAAWLTRARMLNKVMVQLLHKGRIIPRQLWRRFIGEIATPGEAMQPGSLVEFSKMFEKDNKALVKSHDLPAECLKRDRAQKPWSEADPEKGFRASQYVAAFLPRIDIITRQAIRAARQGIKAQQHDEESTTNSGLTATAERLMSDRAKENFHELKGGRFAPHNRIGRVNEEELAAAFSEVPMRDLPKGNSGNVIVGCMKNEAPYILEWVAFHRAIGVDNFIIYTNDCTDGTSELLDRLQELGVLQHRNNDNWKGNSPQQYALNQSLKEDVILNAEWVIHIDVDEFMNVRCGNGTLEDFLERIPDATNVAMTWRLFGHNDVTKFEDELVIEQFDQAAPKYCPKPHTVWGFKTMMKNIGAYEKISCHRPNKLRDTHRQKVHWVNGSGQPMGDEVKEGGWRSSLGTIGYDLLQLNHYALRSAESFLIKRQRGRALHVDRSIGINYWVRMDWGGNKDVTIKRNIPRTKLELARLLEDQQLRTIHEAGVAWHKAKAAELHAMPEFQELYAQALETDLTEMERVAYSLALDMES